MGYDIKTLKPSVDSKYRQGYFIPSHPEKYKGSLPIIYRSGLEKKIFSILDLSNSIVEWSSESVKIQYWDPLKDKYRTYFPDVCFKDKDGEFYLGEIKPASKLKRPVKGSKMKASTWKMICEEYIINAEKIKAMKNLCSVNGYHAVIMDESFTWSG